MEGYMGTLLRLNLTNGAIRKEPLQEEILRQFMGGRGLNSKLLYDEVQPGTDPLGPENKIIMSPGPCNGTLVPGSSRFTVTAKSPMTGLLGDSNAGGFFGAELKYAGYDGILIEGIADRLVYLWIDDDRVEIRPAEHLRGKTNRETVKTIQKENFDPDLCVVSIGPAGENRVRFREWFGGQKT
jgi:aldehyde:ferredoxin oxidoreductase